MHESKRELRLFLASAAKDSGTVDKPVFRIPDILGMKSGNYECYLTVERFNVESSLFDKDDIFVLRMTSEALPNQYDSVKKASANIVAVAPQSQPPGVYKTGPEPLSRIPCGNLLGKEVRLELASLKTKSNVLDYHQPFLYNSDGNETTNLRDFFCVIKLEFCNCS